MMNSASVGSPMGNKVEDKQTGGYVDQNGKSFYDKINKPFQIKFRPIAENLKQYNQFLSLLMIPRGLRAKRLNKRKDIIINPY